MNLKNQSTTLSQSNREASDEKRLNNLLGDILRSKDLTTEPQKHIDRLYTQAEEALYIYDKLDSETQKKFDMDYIRTLHDRLGKMSVKVKNSMTSPQDFYLVMSAPESQMKHILALFEINKTENSSRLERSKQFLHIITDFMGVGAPIEEAVELARHSFYEVDISGILMYYPLDDAVKKAGVSLGEYIREAFKQRLKAEGFYSS